MFQNEITFIRSLFNASPVIPLHEPCFIGNEKKYVNMAIDSTFVSSVGEYVNRFEKMICDFTGAKFAIATVNGTSALHTALLLAGVSKEEEVITQAISFIATSNAIMYCGATPVFIDIDADTLGLSPHSLKSFLDHNITVKNGSAFNKKNGKRIAACLPMHTFGHPCRIDEIVEICKGYNIPVVEDAAESIGTTYKNKQTGTFGRLGIFSFNGNKIVTAGGGGVIVTNDASLAKRGKHITTTARADHPYEIAHDMIGFNYRMPNLNAALVCAQLENIDRFIESKRELASQYKNFFKNSSMDFFCEPYGAKSNYWLNTLIAEGPEMRDIFLKETNEAGILTRPVWKPIHRLEMYVQCETDSLENSNLIEKRLVNIPSSARL